MFTSIAFGENTSSYLQANLIDITDDLKVKICLLKRGITVLTNNDGFYNDTDTFIHLTDITSGYIYTYTVSSTDKRQLELHVIPCNNKGVYDSEEFRVFYIGMFNCFKLGISRNRLPHMTDEELEQLNREDDIGGIVLIE